MKIKKSGALGYAATSQPNQMQNVYTCPAGRIAIIRVHSGPDGTSFTAYINGLATNIATPSRFGHIILMPGETLQFMHSNAAGTLTYVSAVGEEIELDAYDDQYYAFGASLTTTNTRLYTNTTGKTLYLKAYPLGTGIATFEIYQVDGNSYTLYTQTTSGVPLKIIMKPGDYINGKIASNTGFVRFQGQWRSTP